MRHAGGTAVSASSVRTTAAHAHYTDRETMLLRARGGEYDDAFTDLSFFLFSRTLGCVPY